MEKSGTKAQCLKSAVEALKDGKSVFIDRCNIDRQQRAEFVKLGGPQVDVHAVVLDLPARLCISRSVKRTGHEGNLQGGKAAAVVNRMLQNKELPKLNEGKPRCNGSIRNHEILKKVENPAKDSNVNCSHGTVSNEETEEPAETSSSGSTLAFRPISTADFQFNLEKASDVIVEEVEKFLIREAYCERINLLFCFPAKLKPGGGGVNAAIFNAGSIPRSCN
ncbi:hypothetical protein IFM89_023451 [Coptis chinensis]|uniref:Uncharacterized protein n=1 Tax=Coptis chinensis TaxID=261450 RepID=A0A835HF24_9MAGN|nr:hypothetical protein IFM89_023451 [Coptis chinensis]